MQGATERNHAEIRRDHSRSTAPYLPGDSSARSVVVKRPASLASSTTDADSRRPDVVPSSREEAPEEAPLPTPLADPGPSPSKGFTDVAVPSGALRNPCDEFVPTHSPFREQDTFDPVYH